MVLPLAAAIIGGKYLIKKSDGTIEEVTKDIFDDAINQGAVIVESFADLIGDLGESIAEGTLGAVRGAGVAVLDASQATYTYISDKISDRRVEAVAVAWAMTIYGLTAFTILNRIKKA